MKLDKNTKENARNLSRAKRRSNRGLTLVEVLIAMSILAFISVYTAQSIRSAINMKNKLGRDIDGISLVRDALKIMQSDVSKAFNYQNIHVELYNQAQEHRKESKTNKKPSTPAGTPPPGSAPGTPPVAPVTAPTTAAPPAFTYEPKKAKILTHFIGEKDKINFASLSNIRSRAEQKVSDQAEVGYRIKPCKSQMNKSKSSKCLWRRVAPIIDDEPTEGGRESVLLEGVNEFEIKYYSRKKEEWLSSWDSKDSLDVEIKGQFPDAVEIKLSVTLSYKGKEKNYSLSVMSPLRTSINSRKEGSNDRQTPGTPPPSDQQ